MRWKTFAALVLILAGHAAPAFATTWGPEERLTATSTDSETGLNHTPMACDGTGRIHVAWAEQDGVRGNYQIYTRRRIGGVWGPSTLVVPFRNEFAGSLLGSKFPTLVCDAKDTLHVAWHDYRVAGINNSEIFYKKCYAGAAWDTSVAAEVRLTTTNHPETNGDNGYVPTLSTDRYGNLHLAWYDFRYDGSAAEILVKSRIKGGWNTTPGDAADQDVSNTAGDSENPAMAVDFTGDQHLAWQDDTAGGFRILYAVRDGVTGAVSSPITLSLSAAAAVSPAIAADALGNLTVVWADSREGSKRLFSRSKPYGGAWGPERPASASGFAADEPALAVDSFRRVYLAWHDTRISAINREVFAKRKEPGADWDSTTASDFRVSNGSGNSTRPSLLIDNAGHVDVLWKDRRDGNNEIYFREGAFDVPSGVEDAAPTRPSALVASANPFRTSTTFRAPVGVVTGSAADLTIVNAAGALVRRARLDAAGTWSWDGADDSGRPAPPGVYFARAAGHNGTVVKLK